MACTMLRCTQPLSTHLMLLILPGYAAASAHSGFLAQQQPAHHGTQCVADSEPCKNGVDCCGVCAYIGASTWACQACTAVGEECIPMGNRCCDGGNKQKDVALAHPAHTCQATDKISEKYGITKYTCQASAQTNASLAATGQASSSQPARTNSAASAELVTAQQPAVEGASQCIADGKACMGGVDCCGVCAYIGASTWACQACTVAGEECIPMGNRCCDGGNKQKDVALAHPAHTCQATDKISEKYGITKYTCQASAQSSASVAALTQKRSMQSGAARAKNDTAASAELVIAQQSAAEEAAQCIGDGKACVGGVDCCGVCAYIGASTWTCQACTAVGEECIPMGNRCCDGGNKQKDVALAHPAHACKATNETSEKYGITKYTCQASV